MTMEIRIAWARMIAQLAVAVMVVAFSISIGRGMAWHHWMAVFAGIVSGFGHGIAAGWSSTERR